MRNSIWMMLVLAGVAGVSAAACGGDNPNFACDERGIANGSTVECTGHFGSSVAAAPYSCAPIGATLTVHSLGPQSPNGFQPGEICPTGTTPQADAPASDNAPSGDPSGAVPETTTPASGPGAGDSAPACADGYRCTSRGKSTHCVCTKCDAGFIPAHGACVPKGNNGVGNGVDPQPPGDPPINDGPGTSPGNPGAKNR
jgi:hypothetical protein